MKRTFVRASPKSERRALTATTAVIKTRLTAYCAVAAAPRGQARRPGLRRAGAWTAPAAVAASATHRDVVGDPQRWPLLETCVIKGARQTTNRPAAQPKRTIEATPKTNESETPPVSIPSTGTGKLSASVEAASSAASPTSVVVLCGVTANESAAAQATPKPATHTGTMTARTRVGGKTR